MTDNQSDMLKDDADEIKETGEKLGEWLKAAREAQGLSVASVAEQLHLRPSIVNDIESDNYDNIASVTYVKGYVKNYARMLGLDKAKVDVFLVDTFPEVDAPAMQSFSRKTTRQARDGRLMLVTYLIVFILLALLVLWWVQKSALVADIDLSQPTVEETAEASLQPSMGNLTQTLVDPQADTGIEVPTESGTQNEHTEISKSTSAEVESATTGSQTRQSQAADLQAPELQTSESQAKQAQNASNSATTTEAELQLSLNGDCWIKVTDAQGKVLVNGLKLGGREINVFGQEPFKVILGAPQSLTMRLNGDNIDLAKYPSGRVARLTVSSSVNL